MAQCIDSHILEQGHLIIQSSPDEGIGLCPQTVAVIGADGEVIPIHANDKEILTIYQEPMTLFILCEPDSKIGFLNTREDNTNKEKANQGWVKVRGFQIQIPFIPLNLIL